ncbi:lysozyme-like [Vanessa cardui]|uniref:lysozyme-like n=1 Tax=Vanessa cardui TaxID=171605 RepID=UPI001F14645A|nr:lysozyme-like [Vanessa cardui]XP_046969447.1 lysozyme-like [Vanessa cardui]XP_046969448.1 lysozyme-like [Vanessa cardui]
MIIGLQITLPTCLLAAVLFWTNSAGVFIPNLTEACYRCLCHVSTRCLTSHECTGGYCGPFNISKVYWIDSGKVTLPDDDPIRSHAWEDCARSYYCSKRIIEGYLEKFGKDCNGDGVTNCFDYMMINGNGGYGCTAPLNRTENGRRWLSRYEECRHSLE